jgi:hypothetical protein
MTQLMAKQSIAKLSDNNSNSIQLILCPKNWAQNYNFYRIKSVPLRPLSEFGKYEEFRCFRSGRLRGTATFEGYQRDW